MKTAYELLNMLQQMRFKFVTDREMAEHLEISPQHLSDILLKKRCISTTVAEKLGYRAVVRYAEIGSFEDPELPVLGA